MKTASRASGHLAVFVVVNAAGLAHSQLVIRQGMVLALIGVVIGIAGAFGMTRFLASFLFDVNAWDPLALVLG